MVKENPFSWIKAGMPADEQNEFDAALKQNEQAVAALQASNMQLAKLTFDVFENGRGPEWLDWVRSKTIGFPLLLVGGMIGGGEVNLSPSDWAYFRAGQNSIVHLIDDLVTMAATPLPQPEGTENGSD
jgi:hypothetical protein